MPLSFFERLNQIRFRGLQCRYQSKDNSRQQRNSQREKQHGHVDADVVRQREPTGRQSCEKLDAPDSQEDPHQATQQGEQQALSQELANQAESASPKG